MRKQDGLQLTTDLSAMRAYLALTMVRLAIIIHWTRDAKMNLHYGREEYVLALLQQNLKVMHARSSRAHAIHIARTLHRHTQPAGTRTCLQHQIFLTEIQGTTKIRFETVCYVCSSQLHRSFDIFTTIYICVFLLDIHCYFQP